MTVFNDEEQNKRLDEVRAREEESSAQRTAADMGLLYVDLAGMGINMDALQLIDEPVARASRMATFAMIGKNLSVAVKSAYDDATAKTLNDLENRGYITTIYLASMASLEKAWARYADISESTHTRQGLLDISPTEVEKLAAEIHTNRDISERLTAIIADKDTHKTSHIMEVIFGSAIGTKTSDVHIEAAETDARLRFRQDGVLQDIMEFPLDLYRQLNSRIKLLSEMKISNSAIAQDGRFTITYKSIEIEIRTSLIPGPYGESIVMRILNPEGLTVDFTKLGFDPALLAILQEEIKKPNGMILNTGPTGSGKTTTLYSILKTIYSPEIKILTIEDPIEYHLNGITQTQVDHEKGYDFSNGLRAALRQDPDVVMVGEIRDNETATTAVNASLTGHLVLSTLHTNSAAGAIPRMIELGASPRILPDAVTICMAQRMVRRLCTVCKRPITLHPEQESLIRRVITVAQMRGKPLAPHNITPDMPLNLFTTGGGCDQCNMTGYRGQIGLFEAIRINDTITDIIMTNPSERDIRRGSMDQGIFTMAEDGVVKIINGITSLEEVQSVVDLTEDLDVTASGSTPVTPVQSLKSNPLSFNIPKTVDQDSAGTTQNVDGEFKPETTGSELEALINYLKLIEATQSEYPTTNAHDDVRHIEDLIITMLKTRDLHELFSPASEPQYVEHEIQSIMTMLERLKQHQAQYPQHGIAHHLENVRKTIEKLMPKE